MSSLRVSNDHGWRDFHRQAHKPRTRRFAERFHISKGRRRTRTNQTGTQSRQRRNDRKDGGAIRCRGVRFRRRRMSILSPLALMAALRAEAPLFLTIRQADVDDDGNASNDEVIFVGEIVKAKIDGDWVTGTVVSGGSRFDRQITRIRYQRDCNNAWADIGCAIDKDNWKL